MKKLYVYTTYTTDRQALKSEPRAKMTLEELQAAVGGYIQIVPKDYYLHANWGRCTVYVDEEGMFKQKQPNPFFTDLGQGFQIVGTALKEEVYHG